MHLLVLGGGDEAGCRFRLVNQPIAMDLGTARLRLGLRPERLRSAFGMIEAAAVAVNRFIVVVSQELRVQHGRGGGHALAPFRVWGRWVELVWAPAPP